MTNRKRATIAEMAREGGTFSIWPHVCARSEYFYRLSSSAKALLFELLGQYRHLRNNGDLTCAYSLLRKRGWSSKGTIQRARDELLITGWIVVTRYGGLGITELYGLTFVALDECGGKVIEYPVTGCPLGYWKTGTNPDYKAKMARRMRSGAPISAKREQIPTLKNGTESPDGEGGLARS